jgi:hypothetical protein
VKQRNFVLRPSDKASLLAVPNSASLIRGFIRQLPLLSQEKIDKLVAEGKKPTQYDEWRQTEIYQVRVSAQDLEIIAANVGREVNAYLRGRIRGLPKGKEREKIVKLGKS